MVRNLPPYEPRHPNHPILSLSLLALSIAASMAILSTLCASCHRKPSPEKQPSKQASPTSQSNRSSVKEKVTDHELEATTVEVAEDDQHQQQPDSPSSSDEKVVLEVSTHGPILPTVVTERSPKRRLSMNLSMKLPDGLSKIRTRERHAKDGGEETIWKKTIILGEKCRVPSEDDEDGSASAGGETSRMKNYHPKTPKSLPMSRTNSFGNTEVQ